MSSLAVPPLAGVVVLDLTQIYNGPYATFLLAQAGATVIKIEPPDGEHLRRRPRSPGVAEPFAVLNANKKSIAMNLRQPGARRALLRMAAGADVIVENFAPGVMDRLGLDRDTLRQANPRLIIASSSGYGSTGPYRDYPAMDLTVQAMSGVMSVTGMPDGPPLKAGPAVCDFFAGVHLYGGIVTALYERARTGHAATVEVSMLSSVYPSLLSSLGLHRRGDRSCKRTGNRHGGLTMAPYNVYPAADGAIAILTVSDAHWTSLAQALDCEQWLADPRFATRAARIAHMDELDHELGRITGRMDRDRLFDLLVRHRVPCAPVRELDEVVHDPHLHATGMLKWVRHPAYGEVLAHGSPLVFDGHETPAYRPSPALGSDTRDILHDMFGMSADDIQALEADGAFGP
ncbi:MAG: CoA transferase [Pigmentiphaga sp.]|uniref:CaiB/BaiF CoA transferase family protein n=1 Tax=Pigmentiphaga sp. TaxID=1977564 RepID=UPI0029AF4C05|nr:CoA transferase [Pigmentiphaga sp.]MDX3907031.1 CoA transferase [Pigmentiphaga sp.]